MKLLIPGFFFLLWGLDYKTVWADSLRKTKFKIIFLFFVITNEKILFETHFQSVEDALERHADSIILTKPDSYNVATFVFYIEDYLPNSEEIHFNSYISSSINTGDNSNNHNLMIIITTTDKRKLSPVFHSRTFSISLKKKSIFEKRLWKQT